MDLRLKAAERNPQGLQVVEWDDIHNLIKVNPLINWSEEDVAVTKDAMYLRTSCRTRAIQTSVVEPCTRAIQPGEDMQAEVVVGMARTSRMRCIREAQEVSEERRVKNEEFNC